LISKLVIWLRQPTTVAGISAALGTALALVLHQISFSAAVPLLTGALVSVLMPDNTGAKTDAQAVASAVAESIAAGKLDPLALAPQLAALVGDIDGASASLTLTTQK
jgi:hypothetical protein